MNKYISIMLSSVKESVTWKMPGGAAVTRGMVQEGILRSDL